MTKLCECGCGQEFEEYNKWGHRRRFVNGGHAVRTICYSNINSDETILCACGCGTKIPKYSKYGELKKFVNSKHFIHSRCGQQYLNRNSNEIVLCGCGCGTKINKFDRRGRERKFVIRHHSKGLKRSDECKLKMSLDRKGKFCGANNPCYGKPKSDETKQKISEANKGKQSWNKGLTKETDDRVKKISVPRTKEHKLKSSIAIKHYWDSLSEDKKIRRIRKHLKRNWGSKFGNGGFREDIGHYVRSNWEANVVRILKMNNILYKYEPNTFVLSKNTYTPDFLLDEFNIYIEVKGFMSNKDKRKIDLFRKEFPTKTLILVGKDQYMELKEIFKSIIINWEGQ